MFRRCALLPLCVCAKLRLGDGRRRDWCQGLAIGWLIPRQTRQHAKASPAAIVHELFEQRVAASFSRCRDPRRRAGSCVVAVIPTGFQGHAGI